MTAIAPLQAVANTSDIRHRSIARQLVPAATSATPAVTHRNRDETERVDCLVTIDGRPVRLKLAMAATTRANLLQIHTLTILTGLHTACRRTTLTRSTQFARARRRVRKRVRKRTRKGLSRTSLSTWTRMPITTWKKSKPTLMLT